MNPISSLAAPLASDRGALWLRVGRMFTGRDTTTLTDAHLVYNGVSILHAGPDVPAAAFAIARSRVTGASAIAQLEGDTSRDERALGRIFGEDLPSGLVLGS